ncbi:MULTISPECIES: stalk domain-containing protein [Paenibacillus]|uniref:stalk domain-containing protein n=1 Tax=Paenibacillus TaxID=44249 RepID=UPI0028EFB51D|nr:stalk domain-containing protein [Paenibacillus xylanexedens]
MKKKAISFFVIISLLILSTVSQVGAAPLTYSVFFNQVKLDVIPINYKGKLYFDAKQVFQSAQYKYYFDTKEKTYIIDKAYSTGQKTIRFKTGEKKYTLNSEKHTTTEPPIYINNKTLITPLFFSEVTEEKLSITESKKIINFGNYDMASVGNIKGVLTWQYNKYIGTKPDVNAKIVLIPRDIPKYSRIHDTIFGITFSSKGTNGIYTSKADGYGSYNIDNVPTGRYFLLFSSKNTNSDMTIGEYDQKRLEPLFGIPTWENIILNLKLNKYELREIEISKDHTLTESHDFGYTYF